MGCGKFFEKIDIMNSFFQILVHSDDIPLTAVNTLFGMYEWIVMLMEGTNIPAIHQQYMI